MPEIELSCGTISYVDTAGQGPVLVFTHGLLMDGSVWAQVVGALQGAYRCILPTLPLGAHSHPMRPDADLSLHGQAMILAQFIERLDLRSVTLIANDWGGPILTAVEHPERLARLVLTPCEAFDNIPPGLPGAFAGVSMALPGGVFLGAQLLRWRAMRRLPFTFGWMSKRPVPEVVFDAWLRPCLSDAGVRRDLRKYVCTRGAAAKLKNATLSLRHFRGPALVAWCVEDRIMPPRHGRMLAELLPKGRLVEFEDAFTLLSLDQPVRLAQAIDQFVRDTPLAA